MPIIAGYIFVGPRTVTERKQKNTIVRAGADASRIFVDHAPSREMRDRLISVSVRTGDTIVLAMASSIAGSRNAGRERARIVRDLADRGVMVQVGKGPAVLYDDDDKVAEFVAMALSDSRRANIKALGAGPGRPPRVKITDEQKGVICPLWFDKNVPAQVVYDTAARMLGVPVERHHIQYWCGPLRQKPKDENAK